MTGLIKDLVKTVTKAPFDVLNGIGEGLSEGMDELIEPKDEKK